MYRASSEDGNILEFARKDQTVVIFITIVSDGKKNISRLRRRLAKTATNSRTSRFMFGNAIIKWLEIPEFIDLYDRFINGVDVADQLRSYYNTQHIYRKTWKPLWYFMLDIAVCNAYKIAYSTPATVFHGVFEGHRHKWFRMELAGELFERQRSKIPKLADLVSHAPPYIHGDIIHLGRKWNCKVYQFNEIK